MNNFGSKPNHHIKSFSSCLPFLLFLCTVCLSILTAYSATGNFLDSDASSELMLSYHLAQTGQFLSSDWIYSTELRVLNTQLVYTPLFLLFHDWHMVRFFGAIILQAIMVLSYGFLLKAAGFSKRVFWLSASLILLPVSVAYGRIVLYHCYYIPHISLSFVILGLTIKFAEPQNWKLAQPYIALVLLALLSFIGGLGGVRQPMITHAPTLLCIVVFCFIEDSKATSAKHAALFSPRNLQLLLCSLFATGSSFAGLLFCKNVLAKHYVFSSYSETRLGILSSRLDEMLYGLLHQFGFRQDVPLISLFGILSLGGIAAAAYSIFICIKKIFLYRQGSPLKQAIVQAFFIYYLIVMIGVFFLTGEQQYYYFVLYLTLCIPWAAPLLLSHMEEFTVDVHPFHCRRIFSWLTVLILVANGLVNCAYFLGVDRFKQTYEGLNWTEDSCAEDNRNIADFLVDHGYQLGYATFWYGNVLTEMTDGYVQTINIAYDAEQNKMSYRDWLTLYSLREQENEKPFLLLSQEYKLLFEGTEAYQYCTQIYEDSGLFVYSITDLPSFQQLLS